MRPAAERARVDRVRRGAGRARAAVGLRQDRDRRVRPRPGRARASRSSRPAAPPGRSREAGIPVRSITDLTGFPEIMDGRVKTLHPKLYAGLLARARQPRAHARPPREHDVEFVDLVCVNLYPFERTAAPRGVGRRRGDREHRHRRPDDDPRRGQELRLRRAGRRARRATTRCSTSCASPTAGCRCTTRESLAAEAFAYTARYDTAIARWFQEKREDFPPLLVRAFEKVLELPYGENPHQRAAYYAQVGARTHVLSMVSPARRQAALVQQPARPRRRRGCCSAEFQIPACVIIKHNNPCGVAVGADRARGLPARLRLRPDVGLRRRRSCLNRPVDARARRGARRAVHRGAVRPRLRRRRARGAGRPSPTPRILDDRERRDAEHDRAAPAPGRRRPARPGPRRRPRGARRDAGRHRAPPDRGRVAASCSFAWRVCKHVRSNAIVLARDLATVGIGAGQMSRVDSVRLALEKARDRARAARCWPPTPTSRSPTARAGARGRRHGDHPARRLGPRPRGRRGGRRGRRRDGVHQPPPLPPLTDDRSSASAGDPPSPYEEQFGFSRVVRAGRLRARRRHHLGRRRTASVLGETPYEQAVEILRKIEHELGRAGAGARRRDPDPRLRDRHLPRRGGRPRPRRGLRRDPPADDDGRGQRPDRPADAGRDRGGRDPQRVYVSPRGVSQVSPWCPSR